MAVDLLDDLSIADDDELWRRLNPKWVIYDGNLGQCRLTSQAFQNYPKHNSLSVLLAEYFASYEEPLGEFSGYGLASLRAGQARDVNQGVKRDPTESEAAHALVIGDKPKSVRSKLAKVARIRVMPTSSASSP